MATAKPKNPERIVERVGSLSTLFVSPCNCGHAGCPMVNCRATPGGEVVWTTHPSNLVPLDDEARALFVDRARDC